MFAFAEAFNQDIGCWNVSCEDHTDPLSESSNWCKVCANMKPQLIAIKINMFVHILVGMTKKEKDLPTLFLLESHESPNDVSCSS
jgi:hypothetical protein